MMNAVWYGCLTLLVSLIAGPALGQGPQMMQPRVPPDQLAEAQALRNPIALTPEVLRKGKELYEGKGTCMNCHGLTGHGNGPGAANLNPPPRVFRSHGFWNHRTEGEIFWVIKHGSPGTGMIPFGGLLSDQEIWTVMHYERSFAGRHGRGGRHGMGRHRGKGGMGQERPRGRMGNEGCCQ